MGIKPESTYKLARRERPDRASSKFPGTAPDDLYYASDWGARSGCPLSCKAVAADFLLTVWNTFLSISFQKIQRRIPSPSQWFQERYREGFSASKSSLSGLMS